MGGLDAFPTLYRHCQPWVSQLPQGGALLTASAPMPLPGTEPFPLALARSLALGFEAHGFLGRAAAGGLWHPGLTCRRALTLWESSSTGVHIGLTPRRAPTLQEGSRSSPYSGLTPRRPATFWEGSSSSPHPRTDPQKDTDSPASPITWCSPAGERIWPQAELWALTLECPSRRSLWKTWQNFQQSTALPDSGSRFTTDQKVCAPFSWCVPRMHGASGQGNTPLPFGDGEWPPKDGCTCRAQGGQATTGS